MRLKQRVGDFRVRELLRRDVLADSGDFRVYRVTKRKLTSDDAARALAEEAGVELAEVGMAGLKDRQGLTIQYMSVARGRPVELATPELKIEPVGFAARALTSEDSLGNAFELTVRALGRGELHRLRLNLPLVRAHGTLNYFDDQRFGNLTHGQGWIYKGLCLGETEAALRRLLGAPSARDDERHRRFKDALAQHWGDWRECRDDAGRFGAHHSVFEHLAKNPDDFAGAFQHVSTRVKLIHLFAWQSHLWNRALAEWVRSLLPVEERVVLTSEEGNLIAFAGAPPAALAEKPTLRLPGERLTDVADPGERALYERVLAEEELAPERMAVEGVPGFHLKGEEREVFLRPAHLRVRPPEDDALNRGAFAVRVRFELPRGSYATLVVKRLFAEGVGERREREEECARRRAAEGPPEDRPEARSNGWRGPGPRRPRGPRGFGSGGDARDGRWPRGGRR
jgi:tRNA pseudouridine13 synthase